MKKQSLLLFGITALLFSSVKAQKADTIRAKATYGFSHITDTLNRDKPFTQEMVLLLGSQSSAYLSLDKINFDLQRQKDIEEQIKNSIPGKISLNMKSSPKKLSQEELYMYTEQKKLITKKRLVNNYLIEEKLPEMNWTITTDTATISGLKCQKANTSFMGRTYTAWFCPDLPFQSGPWKLNGLPGLIVAAHDAKKEVVFDFLGFENIKHTKASAVKSEEASEISDVSVSGKLNISKMSSADLLNSPVLYLPKGAIKTTEQEYQKLAEAMRKDPEGFISSSLPGTSFKRTTANKSTVNPAVINNPIEITAVK